VISDNLWQGQRVRLTGLTKDDMTTAARWYDDAGFLRLLDAEAARPRSADDMTKWLEEEQKNQRSFQFAVRPLDSDALIGVIVLDGILWSHGVSWLSIGIGDRENWGKGYGHEAMTLLLNYAFSELNLHRVQLTVFEYNARAIALYERLGFQREGTYREFMQRDGQRFDMYLYGLLDREWQPPTIT
jgi:RimJ/RimL family protein N-acetyltransferase